MSEVETPRRPRLAGDAVALAASATLAQGAGLAGTIVLARLLSQREFGGYQQLLLVYAIISPLLYGGVPAALTYYIARAESQEERARWTFDALVALTALGVLFAVGLILARQPLAALMHNRDLAPALALLAPYALLTFLASLVPNALIPVGRARLSALLSLASSFVYVSAIVVGGIVARDVGGLALAMAASSLFSAVVGVVAISRTVGIQRDWPGLPARVREFLAYGLPLALTGLAGVLGFQFDRLVVTAHFSPSKYAIYAVGAVELPITLIVQQSINSVLLPQLAVRHRDGDVEGLGTLWREAIRKSSLVLLPLFALSWVVAGDLVHVFFGGRYDESVSIFRIYLLLMPLRVATYGLLPMAVGRTRINLGASIVVLASNAVLAIALVGPLGLKGPAIATVIATGLTVAYYLVRLRGILNLPIRALFPWRLLAINLALSVVVAGVLAPVTAVSLPAGAMLVAWSAAYAATYVVVMRLTKRIRDDDWRRLVAFAMRPFVRKVQTR